MIIGEAAYMLTKEFKDAHPATDSCSIEIAKFQKECFKN